MVEIVEIGNKLKRLKQFDFVLLKIIVGEPNITRIELTKKIKDLQEIYGFHAPVQSEYTHRLQLIEELGFIKRTRGHQCIYSVKEEYKFCLLQLTGAYFEIWGKLRGDKNV